MKPDSSKGTYAVLFAKCATGHVLKKDLTLYLGEESDTLYTYFEDLDKAKTYVIEQVTNKTQLRALYTKPVTFRLYLYMIKRETERLIEEEGVKKS